MPKLDLRSSIKQEPRTIADVAVGEWWLGIDGTPYQREHGECCVYYHAGSSTFCISEMSPEDIMVNRKLCGPIELIWE